MTLLYSATLEKLFLKCVLSLYRHSIALNIGMRSLRSQYVTNGMNLHHYRCWIKFIWMFLLSDSAKFSLVIPMHRCSFWILSRKKWGTSLFSNKMFRIYPESSIFYVSFCELWFSNRQFDCYDNLNTTDNILMVSFCSHFFFFFFPFKGPNFCFKY